MSVTVCPTIEFVIAVLSFASMLLFAFSVKIFLVYKQMFEIFAEYFAILLKFHHSFTLLYLKNENLNILFCTQRIILIEMMERKCIKMHDDFNLLKHTTQVGKKIKSIWQLHGFTKLVHKTHRLLLLYRLAEFLQCL